MEKPEYSITTKKITKYLYTNPALQRIIKGKLQNKEGYYYQEKNKKLIFFQHIQKKIATQT